MKFGQLHHVEYYVDDLECSNGFWSWFLAEFGYTKTQEWSEGVSWAHENGTYLVFVQVENRHLNAGNNRQGAGLNHIAICGSTEIHLNELASKLETKSVHITKRDDKHLCFIDVNGFAIEVFLPFEEKDS